MKNVLLDYFFPITAITPTAQASTDFLKQVCVVVKPKSGVTSGTFSLCTTSSQVAALTDNTEALQLFAAGLNRVYILAVSDLDIAADLEANTNFYTLLISSDFTDANVTAADFGTYDGVISISTTDQAYAKAFAAQKNQAAFLTNVANKAKNMMFAFGSLLSNQLSWANQQYINLPFADDIDTTGEAESLFADRVSFGLTDIQYATRLSLFAAGGQAIVAPYVIKNLGIDIQSKALQYVSGNQPNYTKTHASLLEDELQKVIDLYITRGWIEAGEIEVKLEQDNFVASAYINVAEPKALWRILGQVKQTL